MGQFFPVARDPRVHLNARERIVYVATIEEGAFSISHAHMTTAFSWSTEDCEQT
jgi:hypothetical protein